MQSSKWRFSFNSGRPSRQLKKLWLDCNVKNTDEEVDNTKIKPLGIFLDACSLTQDQQAVRSAIDELLEDLAVIVCTLLHWIKISDLKLQNSPLVTSPDETALLRDVQLKMLSTIELFCTSKGSKSSLKDALITDNNCVKYALKALEVVKEVQLKIGLLRVLKAVVFTEAHLLQLAQLGGFRVLSEVTRSTDQPALTAQVVHLQRLYMEYIQSARQSQLLSTESSIAMRDRAYSASSAGSAPAANPLYRACGTTPTASGVRAHHSGSASALHLLGNMSGPITAPSEQESVDESSMAAKGLNIAFSIVSELLKFAPSTAEWLQGGRREKDNLLVDVSSAHHAELLQVAAMALPVSVLDIEAERVRALERAAEFPAPADGDAHRERSMLYESTAVQSPPAHSGSASSRTRSDESDTKQVGLSLSGKKTSSPDLQKGTEAGDPLEYIRAQMHEQDMSSVLMLAIERAASPSEAVEALLTVQAMLIGNSTSQAAFLSLDGYTALATMLLRVENNLVFLAPCSDQSMAVAAGQPRMSLTSITSSVSSGSGVPGAGPPTTPGKASAVLPGVLEETPRRPLQFPHVGTSEPMGQYGTFAKGEFDLYYSTLVMVLLNIVLDDLVAQQLCAGTNLPFLPPRGGEVKNFRAVGLLLSLLQSPTVGLNTVALRVCYALLRMHAPNVAIFEVLGVVSALVEKLMAIVYVGSLDISSLTGSFEAAAGARSTADRAASTPTGGSSLMDSPTDDNSRPSTDSSSPSLSAVYSVEVLGTVAAEVLQLLQIVAVATANRDNSVAAVFALLLQHSSSCFCCNWHLDAKCQNCEMEMACLQCLNDGCMNDKASLLCQECDNVFHKSTAKKSHIRIPVLPGSGVSKSPVTPSGSQDRLAVSRENSASIGQEDSGSISVAAAFGTGPISPLAVTAAVAREVNEFGKAPMVKHGLMHPTDGTLRGVKQREGSELSSAVVFEAVQCLVVATLRGILDDRKIRGCERSTVMCASLLLTLRSTTCTPFLPPTIVGQEEIHSAFRREMFYAADSLKLSDLVDFRHDVLNSNGDGQRSDGRQAHEASQQPPEVSHTCPRRIRLALLLQCVAGQLVADCSTEGLPSLFPVKDDGYTDMRGLFQQSMERHQAASRAQHAERVHQLMALGGDALLVHLLLDASPYTQLTWVDRQYLIWLFRESAVTAASCRSEHTGRFFHWWNWVVRSNVVGKRGQLEVNRSKQPLLPKKSSSKRSGLNQTPPLKTVSARLELSNPVKEEMQRSRSSLGELVLATIPATAPTVLLATRLLVVQELRLMLVAARRSHSSTDRDARVATVLLCHISIAVPDTFLRGPSASHTPTGVSMPRKSLQGSVPHGIHASHATASLAYHAVPDSHALCGGMVDAGLVEALVDTLLGELCTPSIYRLLRENSATATAPSRAGQGYFAEFTERESRTVSELEKEEWWNALATMGMLLTSCDAAKDRLHDYVGIDFIVKFIVQHLEFIAQMGAKLSSTVDYRSVLNTLLVDLCVRSGHFSPPMKPYMSAVARLPTHHTTTAWSFSDPGPATGSNAAEEGRFMMLYSRVATNKQPELGTPPLARRASSHPSEIVRAASPVSLSPTYFVHDRTCLLVRFTCRPCPLALTSDRLLKAFSPPGSAVGGPSGAVQPLRHHVAVTRASLKSGEGGELRARLSIDSDINLHGAVGKPSDASNAAAQLSRRMLLRRNVSTASVHSAESDSRWDQDSVGLNSSAHGEGRGSFHSFHSLVALSQALTTPHMSTPTASVSGDHAHPSHSHSRPSPFNSVPQKGSSDAPDLSQQSRQNDERRLVRSPFPPMVVSAAGSVPKVRATIVAPGKMSGDQLSTHVLMLLHHALLLRAGYADTMMPGELLDSPTREDDLGRCHSRQHSEDPLKDFDMAVGLRMSMLSTDSAHGGHAPPRFDQAMLRQDSGAEANPVDSALVLRKHLSMFLVAPPDADLETEMHPALSGTELRSPECAELLLAAAVVAPPEDQLFLVSTLSRLLDGNPANAYAFVAKPTTCVALSRLVASLSEETQEKVGYLLSQVLRYSLQQPVLRELLYVVKKFRSMSGDFSAPLEVMPVDEGATALAPENKSLLFVMGRTAERKAPESFLHFSGISAVQSAVELPPVLGPPGSTSAVSEVTVCSWIRLGAMVDAPTASFCQFFSPTSNMMVNVFFRVMHRNTVVSSAKDSKTNMAHRSAAEVQGSKRVVQLCLSFGTGITSSGSHYVDGRQREEDKKTPVAATSPPTVPPTTMSSAMPGAAGPAAAVISGDPHSTVLEAHWRHAVETLCEVPRSSGADGTGDVAAAAVTLSGLVSQFAIPDAIVEFDWSELGDWHLLTLGLSEAQLTCSIDGVAIPVLHWTPLGYEYDAKSAAIKAAMDNSKPTLSSLSQAAVVDAEPPVVGSHPIDFGKGHPISVTLAGLKYEKQAYERIARYRHEHAEEPVHGLQALLHSVDALVSGFCGSIGEVLVLPGVVEASKVQTWVRDGPLNGFRDTKTTKLSSLTVAAMRLAESTFAGPAGKAIAETPAVLAFPSFLGSSTAESAPTTDAANELQVYSTAGTLGVRDADLLGKGKGTKDREAAVKFNREVQIHLTAAMPAAFNRIGGVRALYPLLAADKSRMVAALRMMASLITASKDAYQDFRSVEADKVILYCAVQNPQSVTLETLQVLFDLIVEAAPEGGVSVSPLLPVASAPLSTESIHRVALLELLIDLVLSLPRHSALARGTVDWLREVCDENIPNCQKVLKYPGVLPILVMLSSWELPGCEALNRPAPEPSKTDGVLADSTKVRRERSLSLGSASEKSLATRGTQAVDISKAATGLDPTARSEADRKAADGKARLMDRVNKEFLQRTLAEEQEIKLAMAVYGDKYRMQLSCARFLKLLIAGTSGEVAHGSVPAAAGLLSTATDFSTLQLTALLSFAVLTISKVTADLAAAAQRNTDYMRDKERRQRGARIKKLIYGSFSGIPILRQMDIATPAYWLCSAALVALDALLDASASALHMHMISLLKACFTGTTLQSMMIHLMGSECGEIRERALRILMLSFSTLDGKLDAKQIGYFDRVHGFQCVADQLGAHRDGCTDTIIHGVLNLIFWQRSHRRVSSSSGSESADRRSSMNTIISTTSGDDDEGFYPIKTTSPGSSRRSSVDPKAQQTSEGSAVAVKTSVSPETDTDLTLDSKGTTSNAIAPVVVGQAPSASKASTAPTDAGTAAATATAPPSSGSLMSLFWGSGSAPTPVKPAPVAAAGTSAPLTVAAGSGAPPSPREGESDGITKGIACERPASAPAPTASTTAGKSLSAAHEPAKPLQGETELKVNHIEELRTTVQQRMFTVEVMEVPQALEVLFRVMQNASSVDQVSFVFKIIEQSITVNLSHSGQGNQEFNAAVNQLHLRNAEHVFNQKDWLLWFCDLLVLYRRQALNTDDRDGGASVFSLSESESVGGYYGGGNPDVDASYECSESSSIAGDSVNEDHVQPLHRGAYKSSVGSAESVSGSRISAWQQNLIDQYTNPVYSLIRKLLLQDMVTGKVGSTRRWNELFRLSVPELVSIQERLLLDLVGSMQNLGEFCEDTNSTINLLKNLAAVLEQALEKTDMSLMFNVKVVNALHSLSYNCSPEVRARIKETMLPEVRKAYVVRVVLDNTQDFYTRIAALSEISSPLQGYVATTEAKVLTDTNVLMIILGMLVEACEDLEFLLGGVDSSSAVLNESAGVYRTSSAGEDSRMVSSPIPASTYDRVHVLFEVLEVLIESTQNCALASAECKKCVLKLVGGIAGDPNCYLLMALLKTFGIKSYPHRNGSGTAGTDTAGSGTGTAGESDGSRVLSRANTLTGATTAAAPAAPPASSYTWWGHWSSGPTAPDVTATEAVPAAASTAGDVETGTSAAAAIASEAQGPSSGTSEQDEPAVVGPTSIRTFITWFCATEQREVQAEFRQRVLAEIRSTHRAADKLREKNSQRYMRFTRLAQEKRAKEKQYATKATKDALAVFKAASEKVASKFQRDTKTYVTALTEKFEAGKTLFQHGLEDRSAVGVKSPLKDAKQSAPTPASYKVEFSAPLRAFLRAERTETGNGAQEGGRTHDVGYDASAALSDLISAFTEASTA